MTSGGRSTPSTATSTAICDLPGERVAEALEQRVERRRLERRRAELEQERAHLREGGAHQPAQALEVLRALLRVALPHGRQRLGDEGGAVDALRHGVVQVAGERLALLLGRLPRLLAVQAVDLDDGGERLADGLGQLPLLGGERAAVGAPGDDERAGRARGRRSAAPPARVRCRPPPPRRRSVVRQVRPAMRRPRRSIALSRMAPSRDREVQRGERLDALVLGGLRPGAGSPARSPSSADRPPSRRTRAYRALKSLAMAPVASSSASRRAVRPARTCAMRCRASSSSTRRRSTSSVARRSFGLERELRVGLVQLAHPRLDELVHVRAVQLQLRLRPAATRAAGPGSRR